MNRIRIPVLILCAVVIIYYFASSMLINKPKKNDLFIVEDISSKIISSRTEEFTSAILVNLDDDDEKEIFISGYGVSNLFLKRAKDKFYPIQIASITDPKGLTVSVTACDIDQDGRDEIFILNKASDRSAVSKSKLYKYVKGNWKELPLSDQLTKALETGHAATCIDRKGNGKYGLAVVAESGKHLYLELTGPSVMNISSSIGMDFSSKGRSILGIPGPDGRMNVFIGNEDGANFYFINDGSGNFIEKARDVGLDDPLYNARGISVIDANYDEIPDIVYGNMEGPTRLMIQDVEGHFKNITPEIMKITNSVNTVVAGDFNLDGYEDIYLNNIRGYNKTFANFEDEWHDLEIDTFAEKHMFGISSLAADLDNNGSYEILNTHGDGSKLPITLYSIKPVNQWVKYSIQTRNGGIPRGSTVVLKTTSKEQMRVIHSGSGRYGNYDDDILFSLKKNDLLLNLTIKLPSGKSYEFKPGHPMHLNKITLPIN